LLLKFNILTFWSITLKMKNFLSNLTFIKGWLHCFKHCPTSHIQSLNPNFILYCVRLGTISCTTLIFRVEYFDFTSFINPMLLNMNVLLFNLTLRVGSFSWPNRTLWKQLKQLTQNEPITTIIRWIMCGQDQCSLVIEFLKYYQ
jgi:hypothetical protein